MTTRYLAILALAVSPTSVSAQWMHTTQDDPFQGGELQLAAAASLDGYVAGFRCTKTDDLSMVLVTPEKITDPSASAAMEHIPVKLLVIIDDAEKISLAAKAEVLSDGSTLRIVSEDEQIGPILKSAMTAKKRFAVAAELMGKIYHSKSFKPGGSTRAIGQLAKACKLSL